MSKKAKFGVKQVVAYNLMTNAFAVILGKEYRSRFHGGRWVYKVEESCRFCGNHETGYVQEQEIRPLNKKETGR